MQSVPSGTYDEMLASGPKGAFVVTDPPQFAGVYTYGGGQTGWTRIGGTGVLYSYTVTGADKASIDSAVDGNLVADFGARNVLEVWIIARTDDAGAAAAVDVTLNNDGAASYDIENITGTNVTAAATNTLGGTKWSHVVHGSGGLAGYPSVTRYTFPGYAGTVFNKVGEVTSVVPDSAAANTSANAASVGYRSTAAISRIKVAAQGAAKLKVGTTVIVLAR